MAGFIQKTLITLSLAHIFLAITASIPGYDNLGERMASTNLAPEYEIVDLKLTRVQNRSMSSPVIYCTFNVHGREIKLTLHKTNEAMASRRTPIWRMTKYWKNNTKVSSVKFNKVSKNVMNGIGKIWEDPEKHAAVLISSTSSGQKFLCGYVASQNITIEALASVKSFKNRRSNQNNTNTDSIPKSSRKVKIYKTPQHENRLKYTAVRKSYPEVSQIPGPPDTVYPEILVIVDYLTYKKAGQNIRKLLKYLLPFWYSVDMLYRVFESPKVRFHIAAIVIAIEDDMLPFVYQKDVHSRILKNQTLDRFGKLLMRPMKDNFPLKSYDIAVVMTPRSLCRDDTACELLGATTPGQACRNRIFPHATISYSIAIVNDEGFFPGVITAAHELAHSMGVMHDDYKPFRTDCINRKRNVMTDSAISYFSGWSQCSKKDFDNFFKSGNANCLFNIPPHRQISETATAQSILTLGRVILDNMCYNKTQTMSCGNKVSVNCQLLQCRNYNSEPNPCHNCGYYDPEPNACYNFTMPLQDGAICDAGKICRLGQCVDIG